MAKPQLLELTDFDGHLIDGLSFCRKVYRLFDQILEVPGGRSRLRMLRSKTEKRLVEELIPIARYIQYRYHEAYRIKVRWNAGSQRHDAVLLCSGDWLGRGLAARRLAVEVTMSVHPNEHLVRENVDKGGASFGPENTTRDKKTGKIASEARAGDGWTAMQELAERVTAQIRAKATKGYGSDTVLIVGVVPNKVTLHPEWNEVVRQIVEATFHKAFAEVFVLDRSGSFCATLPR